MSDQKNCECEMHAALMAEFADTDRLRVPAGHPIDIMQRENDAFISLCKNLQEALNSNAVDVIVDGVKKLMSIHSHYGKKEELFMPILYQHGVTGSSQGLFTNF